jgi:hypothetical protein
MALFGLRAGARLIKPGPGAGWVQVFFPVLGLVFALAGALHHRHGGPIVDQLL